MSNRFRKDTLTVAGTVIPPNLLRKKSRALIDRAWAAGNRRPATNGAEHMPVAAPASDQRAEIEKKIEEVAARRKRRRALRF
jgi:hypothetical protein